MLEFFWKDPIYGNGWGHFYLREEGREIVDGWGKEDDMGVRCPWNAVRFEEPGEIALTRTESRLVGTWQPIGVNSPLEISFAPAEDIETATETHAPPREVADTSGAAPVRYKEGG